MICNAIQIFKPIDIKNLNEWHIQQIPKDKIVPNSYKPFCASISLYNKNTERIIIFGGSVSKFLYD